jgi:outer membrane receptor protein involved in Fe transport
MNPFPEREHSETLEQGDPNLLPELVGITEAGIIKDFKGGSFFATAYYQHTKNPIQRVKKFITIPFLTAFIPMQATSKQWGLESGITATPFKWLQLYVGGNVYDFKITGALFNGTVPVNNSGWVYSF